MSKQIKNDLDKIISDNCDGDRFLSSEEYSYSLMYPCSMMHKKAFNQQVFAAAVNTVAAKKWELFMARVWGRKIMAYDVGCKITLYCRKGKMYFYKREYF